MFPNDLKLKKSNDMRNNGFLYHRGDDMTIILSWILETTIFVLIWSCHIVVEFVGATTPTNEFVTFFGVDKNG